MRKKSESRRLHGLADDDAKKVTRSQHVVPNQKGGWSVRKSGSSNVSRIFDDKNSAVGYAIKLAKDQRTELYIHKKDGTIKDRINYGYDSYSRKDKK